MAYKDGVLTINEWTKGQADSPYLGFSSIMNCEVFDTPGVLKIANRTVSRGLTVDGLAIAYVEDAYGNYYYLTNDGKCYKNGTVIQSGLGAVWDLSIYNDYLVVTHSSVVSVYGPLSSGGVQWFGNWKTGLGGTYYAKQVAARNGDLFIGNGASMAKITTFVAGAPTVAPTAVFSTSVMVIPPGQAITTFAELGTYMMIGTQALNGSWANGTNGNVANIYMWDKEDTKPTSLSSTFNECSVQAMIPFGNRMYIAAGNRGNIYLTDSTNYTKIKRIPWTQNKLFGDTSRIYPNAMAINRNGNLLVGTSTLSGSFSSASSTRHGVYEIQLGVQNYPTILRNGVSTGNYGQSQTFNIGFIFQSSGDALYIGFQDGTNYDIDTTDFVLYTNNSAVGESPYYQVASRNKRKTFQHIEFLIGRPLTTGQEINIYYRKNLTDDYTAWKSFTYSNLGAVISHEDKATLADVQAVQFKITLTQPTSSTVGSNIDLLNIILY